MAKHFRATLILPKSISIVRAPLPPHSQTFLDIERTIHRQSASWLITRNCLYMEYKLGTRGNIIYYFSTVGRISSSKLRKPILSPLLFLSNSFIEQFPFLFSFFFPRYRIEEKGFSLLYPDNYSTIRSVTTTMIRD